jgi:hypothetical protein
MRRVWLILMGTAAGLLAAIATFSPVYYVVLNNYPDCAPNQRDGQCGLASFMDFI